MSEFIIAEELRHRHRLIRAGFTTQGTSFQAWCNQEGVTRQNADKALMNRWKGPKAAALVARVLKAAKVNI